MTDAVLATSNVAETDHTAYSPTEIYTLGTRVRVVAANVHKIYESLTGKTATVTMTTSSPDIVTWVGHGLAVGTPVKFTTTGALPTGVVADTVYYVVSAGLTEDAFEIAATPGGTPINTSGSQSGVHTATASANYNKDPATNPTVWLDAGATNRWKMFDSSVTSQTSNANSIDVSLDTVGRVDSVALINIDAAEIHIVMTDATEGVVYDETLSGVSVDGIDDMYDYFFEPINRITDLALTDLPPYANSTLDITLTETGGTAYCGGCVVGQSLEIGDTEVGARIGVQDYSIKQRDSFGNYTILQRAFNKRANYTIHLESTLVDKLQNVLASYRATPIVYIGSGNYGSTIVYGFYKSFEIEIGYLDGMSVCSLEVEGLT